MRQKKTELNPCKSSRTDFTGHIKQQMYASRTIEIACSVFESMLLE